METKKKFKIKRKAKIYLSLSIAMFVFFLLQFATLSLFVSKSFINNNSCLLVVITFMPIFLLLIFEMARHMLIAELQEYKKKIMIYRSRKFANDVIKFIELNDVENAIKSYFSCRNYPDPHLRDYLWGMIISSCLLSKDMDNYKFGFYSINSIKSHFSITKYENRK